MPVSETTQTSAFSRSTCVRGTDRGWGRRFLLAFQQHLHPAGQGALGLLERAEGLQKVMTWPLSSTAPSPPRAGRVRVGQHRIEGLVVPELDRIRGLHVVVSGRGCRVHPRWGPRAPRRPWGARGSRRPPPRTPSPRASPRGARRRPRSAGRVRVGAHALDPSSLVESVDAFPSPRRSAASRRQVGWWFRSLRSPVPASGPAP